MIFTLTLNPAVDRELTVPSIDSDTVLRASQSRVDFGGKGFNVSRLLKNLGVESVAVGFVGGKAGEILQEGLRGLGIASDFVWVPGETRTNISIVAQSGGHYIKVNEKGPTIQTAQQTELLEKIERLAQAGDWWVLAGSLPPGLPDSFYSQVIETLNAHGAKVILDTIGDPLRLGCRAKPFLVKPNTEEARAITGLSLDNPAEIARAAAEIRKMGVENIVVSMGKAGALLQSTSSTWLVHSPRIVEKNPIGAGDSLVGGMVWALQRGLPLEESLPWGVASGAATASLSGTELGSFSLIAELHQQIHLESLDTVLNGIK